MDALKVPLGKEVKAKSAIELLLKNDKVEAEKEYITRKAIDLSFARRLHQERKEAETEAACANAKVSQGWRAEEVKQEDKLAREMVKDKYQCSKDMKKSDVWKNSEEIRELQQKIKYAYLNKDMAIQLAEKKAQQLRKKSQEKEELKQLIEQEKFLQELDIQSKIAEEQKKLKYKEELQDQMIDRQKMREEIYRNLLDEKSFIDESMRTIWQEDKKEEELKSIKKQMAKEEAETMLRAKKLWIEKETKQQQEEDRGDTEEKGDEEDLSRKRSPHGILTKIREYLEDKIKKEKELQEANKKKEEMRLQNRIACVNMICSSEKERLERQRIAQILLDEDSRQKEEEKVRRDFENKFKTAYEYREITAKQMENRLKRLEEEKLEELKFCQQLLEENNRAILREQEQMAHRRQENLEYGKSLKCIMDQHRIHKLKQMEEQYQQHRRDLESLEKRRMTIDEERRKLLKEHVGNLIGFIPQGVIREEDLPYLDPEVRRYYENSIDVKN